MSEYSEFGTEIYRALKRSWLAVAQGAQSESDRMDVKRAAHFADLAFPARSVGWYVVAINHYLDRPTEMSLDEVGPDETHCPDCGVMLDADGKADAHDGQGHYSGCTIIGRDS
jgi:hypothetical protein